MKEEDKERDFLIQCAASGAADWIYTKQSKPSRWMNIEEKKMWNEGYAKAKRACQR